MATQILEFIKVLFESVWDLYQIKFPGFDFTIGSVVVGALIVVFGFGLLSHFTGWHYTAPNYGKFAQSGGNNRNIKISDERSLDTL